MNEKELRKVQLIQLEIGVEIKRICELNHLKYALAYGTLLGAVRHEGFIPWDDDMDIVMPRDDYDKFIKLCKSQLKDSFFLQSYENDDYYTWPFAKIMKNGTIYREEWAIKEAHNGVFVDVFPLDVCPSNLNKAKIQKLKYKFFVRMLQCKMKFSGFLNDGWKQKVEYFIIKFIGLFYSKDTIKNKINNILQEYSNSPCNYYYNLNTPYSIEKEKVNKEWYEKYSKLKFEGIEFSVPYHYHEILNQIYGNYMQLPPIDQRYNRHKIIELKL